MEKQVNPIEDKEIGSDHEFLVTENNTLDLKEENLTATVTSTNIDEVDDNFEDEVSNGTETESISFKNLGEELNKGDCNNMADTFKIIEIPDEKVSEMPSCSKEEEIITITEDAFTNLKLNEKCKCIHFEDVENLLKYYCDIVALYVVSFVYNEEAVCEICKYASKSIFACLSCPFFGCYESGHIRRHVLEAKHCLVVSIKHGDIFCYECQDYVHHESFEDQLYQCQKVKSMIHSIPPSAVWKMEDHEIPFLKSAETQSVVANSLLGIRGFQNIGNCCYINCIIQVLLHNPVLVQYFLLDKNNSLRHKNCVYYELFKLFQRCCRGASRTLRPTDFLYAYQRTSGEVIGVYQQDAGEFFHNFIVTSKSCCGATDENHTIWKNFLKRTFYGTYLNTKICMKCNHTSTNQENFTEVVMGARKIPKVQCNNETFIHLISGLKEKFCTEQKLPPTVACPNCDKKGTTSLFEKIYRLPTTICFHIPRLYWTGRKAKKDTSHLYFPEIIDLSPYVHETVRQNEADSGSYLYVLYGVVQHAGSESEGHYWSYVKHRYRWFQCEDERIKEVSVKKVLSCEASVLFYYKYDWNL
ncbi:ubiquitin carboxyl-terminal hydrolase 22 [Caerostris darwini]|uniref:Ubiquitin carboxyl-terminal hydrolase n=1 Tax=Caerostris darwini TaxID=1538125 RepID=A0AAV4TDP5_9ARAC|nr:ubiquitin carboxyl-terminal hydrolase 22 [Caerostris darwini]